MPGWSKTEFDEYGRDTQWDLGRDHVEAHYDGDGVPARGSKRWTAIWLRANNVQCERSGMTKSEAYAKAAEYRRAAEGCSVGR